MVNFDFLTVKEAAGWVAASLVGGALGLQRLMKFTAVNSASIEHARADESLIKGLRTELERLGAQNGRLADSLNELQRNIGGLNVEVGRLRAENAEQEREIKELKRENERLHDQINGLHTEIDDLRGM